MRRVAEELHSLIIETIGLEGALLAVGSVGLYLHLQQHGESLLAGVVFWGGLIVAGLAVARPRR